MEYKEYQKNYYIKATAEEIYSAITNPFTIELWTGYPAEMSEITGSEFSLWDGDIYGKNLAFESNKMVEQEWYFGEDGEPSIVTIQLEEQKDGTKIKLKHTHIPKDDFKDICEGWDQYYWGGIRDFFEKD